MQDDNQNQMSDEMLEQLRTAFETQPLNDDGTLDDDALAADPTLPSFGDDDQ